MLSSNPKTPNTFEVSEKVKQSQARYKEALLLAMDSKNNAKALKLFTESHELDKDNHLALQEKINLTLKLDQKADIKNDSLLLKKLKSDREEFFDEFMQAEFKLGQEVAFRGYRLLKEKNFENALACFSFVIHNTKVDSLLAKCLFLRGHIFNVQEQMDKCKADFVRAIDIKFFQNVIPKDRLLRVLILNIRCEIYLEKNRPQESYQDFQEIVSFFPDPSKRYQFNFDYVAKLEKKAASLPPAQAAIYNSIAIKCRQKSTLDFHEKVNKETQQQQASGQKVSPMMLQLLKHFNQHVDNHKAAERQKKSIQEPLVDNKTHIASLKTHLTELISFTKSFHFIPEKYFDLAFLDPLGKVFEKVLHHTAAKEFNEMIDGYEKMLEIFPYSYRTRVGLAELYYDLKALNPEYLTKALYHYTKTLELTPYNHLYIKRLYLGRTIVNFELKNYQEAKNDSRLVCNYAHLVMSNAHPDYQAIFFQILADLEIKFNPHLSSTVSKSELLSHEYYLKKAEKYFDQSLYKDADESLNIVLLILGFQNKPRPVDVLKFSIKLFLAIGKIADARKSHFDLIDLNGTNSLTNAQQASIAFKSRSPKDITEKEYIQHTLSMEIDRVKMADEFNKSQHAFGEILFEKGKEYIALNNYPKALECFDTAVEVLFTEAKVYIDRGVVHAQMGQKEKAAADYKKALDIDPNNKRALRNFKLLANEKKETLNVTQKDLNEKKLDTILPKLEKTVKKFQPYKTTKRKKILLSADERAQFDYANALLKDMATELEIEEKQKLEAFINASPKSATAVETHNKKTALRRKKQHSILLEKRKEQSTHQTETAISETASSTAASTSPATPDEKSSASGDTAPHFFMLLRFAMFDIERAIIRRLKSHGADAYLAGSSVPARVKGISFPDTDTDIHTTATPEEIEYLLAGLNLYPTQIIGLYKIIIGPNQIIEVYSTTTQNPTATFLTLRLDELGEITTKYKSAYYDLFHNPYLRLTCSPKDSYQEDPQRVLINIYNAVRFGKLLMKSMQQAMLEYAPKLLDDNQIISTNLKFQKYFNSFHCQAIFKSFFECKNKKGESIISKLFPYTGMRLIKNTDWILNEISLLKKNPKETTHFHLFAVFIVSAWMEQDPAQKQDSLLEIIKQEPLFALQADKKTVDYINEFLKISEPLVISWKKAFSVKKVTTNANDAKWDPRLLPQPIASSNTSAAITSTHPFINK